MPTLTKNLQFALHCPVFFWRDLSDAPPTRVPLFWFICAAANPGGFLSPNSLFIQRGARSWKGRAFPFFSFYDARYFASVFLRVVGAFLRSLDHLDLRPSLLPYPPCSPCSRSLKLPWQKEEGVIRLISGQRKPSSAHSCTITLLLHILNAAKTRKVRFYKHIADLQDRLTSSQILYLTVSRN